jgi:hemerythrin-like domain-containing protein
MSDTIFMLRLEHENLAQLLDLIEDQIQRIESGADADGSLLLLAVEYLKGFPEECHHPKEDLVFRMLQQRAPDRVAGLRDLDAEHEHLARLTERFAKDVRGALDAPEGAPTEALREYIDAYRQHMAGEEQYFFPAALESLSRDDLADLDFQLFDRKDQLFDHAAEARFARLRREIQRRAGDGTIGSEDRIGAAPTDEIALLRELDSVASFNLLMNELGLRLVRYRAGGYALEREGRWLLDIPDCDESRAAWCAYFYLKRRDSDRSR